MTTYNSYGEAKIANPDSAIYKDMHANFIPCSDAFIIPAGELCNPAKYCMTVERFLKSGHEFSVGDVILRHDGEVITAGEGLSWNDWNILEDGDNQRYILRAAVLEKPKRVKVEYAKVYDSIFDLRTSLNAGELFYKDIDDGFYVINSEPQLVSCFNSERVYLKVKTEITERDEFIEMYALATQDDKQNIEDIAGMLYDSGKFKLVEGK